MMITTSIILIFFGCFALYNASKKAVLRQDLPLEKWLQNKQRQSKVIGLVLITIALFVSIKRFNISSGILFFLTCLMSFLSLIIALYPLKKINYKHMSILFVVLLIIEITTI